MKKFLVLVFVLFNQGLFAKAPVEYANYTVSEYSKEKVVTEWNSKEGRAFLTEAGFDNDFYQLAPFYQPQINPVFCGIASLTILNNYFNAARGIASDKTLEANVNQADGKVFTVPFPTYSQITFFDNPAVAKVKAKEFVLGANKKAPFDPGLNLDDLEKMAKALGMNGKAVHAGTALKDSVQVYEQFIGDLKKSTADSKSVMVGNFRGKIYGGVTGGHISPLVAVVFDEVRKDYQILILDVAAFKNPWTWVRGKDLYHAMNSIDTLPTGEKKYRGYIVLEKAN